MQVQKALTLKINEDEVILLKQVFQISLSAMALQPGMYTDVKVFAEESLVKLL
jgi:hypothetical protein